MYVTASGKFLMDTQDEPASEYCPPATDARYSWNLLIVISFRRLPSGLLACVLLGPGNLTRKREVIAASGYYSVSKLFDLVATDCHPRFWTACLTATQGEYRVS